MFDNLDKLKEAYWQFYATLNSMVPGAPKEYVGPQDVNDLVVLLLSHPRSPFTNKALSEYVSSKGISKAVLTEKLIESVDTLNQSLENIRADKAVHFPQLHAAALLQAMRTNLKLIMKSGEETTLTISLASAVDLLYGNQNHPDSRAWITDLFQQANINPVEVLEIAPYHKALLMNGNPNLPIVEWLALRFEKIFNWARDFLLVINESTQFNKNVPELLPWRNSGRFAMQKEALVFLPIINAAQKDGMEFIDLFFRDPFVSIADAIGGYHNRPYLSRIENTCDKTMEFILNLFFEKIPFILPSAGRPNAFFILRTRDEMKRKLISTPSSDKDLLSKLNFKSYLISMGFPSAELPETEYIGVAGLEKAVDIHSFAHICFGGIRGDIWPPFVSSH